MKDTDMTDDELRKLARTEWEADTLDSDDLFIEMRLQAHRAAVMAKAEILRLGHAGDLPVHGPTIATQDDLILTPLVDPLEAAWSDIWPEDTGIPNMCAALRKALAKRGFQLAERREA